MQSMEDVIPFLASSIFHTEIPSIFSITVPGNNNEGSGDGGQRRVGSGARIFKHILVYISA